jgi:hypothetical protein
MNAKIPKLQKGEFSIIFADVKTGKLLDLNDKWFLGVGDFFVIFKSFEEAESFAKNKINANPEVECSIHDENGIQVKLVRKPWSKN